MKLALGLIALFVTAPAMAASLKIPIVLVGEHKTYSVTELQAQLAAKGVTLPESINVRTTADTDVLEEIADKVEAANIVPVGDKEPVYLQRYGTVSDYKTASSSMCYEPDAKLATADEMRAAYSIVGELGDSVLSDQYTVVAVRYADTNMFTPNDKDTVEWIQGEGFQKTVLKAGEIQILATTNDDGTNLFEDILPVCK